MTLATADGICWPGGRRRKDGWSPAICNARARPAWRPGTHRSPLEAFLLQTLQSRKKHRKTREVSGPNGNKVLEPPRGAGTVGKSLEGKRLFHPQPGTPGGHLMCTRGQLQLRSLQGWPSGFEDRLAWRVQVWVSSCAGVYPSPSTALPLGCPHYTPHSPQRPRPWLLLPERGSVHFSAHGLVGPDGGPGGDAHIPCWEVSSRLPHGPAPPSSRATGT